jgi:hypothetical protein
MRAEHERLVEVRGVFNGGSNDDVDVAVGLRHSIKIFGQDCVGAVRDSIFSQVTGFEFRGDNFERTRAPVGRSESRAPAVGGDDLGGQIFP